MATQPRDRVSRTGPGWGALRVQDEEGRRYLNDYVVTPDGIVHVLVEYSTDHPYTDLRLAYRGNWYERTYNECYSPRYCVTLAKRFAKEVINGN